MPRSEWVGEGFGTPPAWRDRPQLQPGESIADYRLRAAAQVCPGYVASLPQAIEAAMCSAWQDKGSLAERLDGEPVTAILRDSIDALRGGIAEVENYIMSEARK